MEDKAPVSQVNEQEVQAGLIKPEDKRFYVQLDRDGKKYIFSVPDGTSLGLAYDTCFEILTGIHSMMQQANNSVAPQAPKDVPVEVVENKEA
jgi:hypothetical protein